MTSQLLVYRFGADAGFEGQLVAALERIEAAGAMKVLDVLFVGRDAGSSELFAIDVRGGRAGGMTAPLLDFRLDVQARRRATRRAAQGERAQLIEALGTPLEPGHALAAILIGHTWAGALDDAVQRIGGIEVSNVLVESTSLTELAPALTGAARS